MTGPATPPGSLPAPPSDAPAFALFSGGHDSLCSTYVAMTRGYADEVVHINTGIGIEQTREFVRETCRAYGWPLNEVSPPVSYREIVLEHGFPGPAQHFSTPKYVGIYVRLKERSLAAFAQQRKTRRGSDFIYVSGARSQESDLREQRVSEWQHAPKKGWWWHAPIHDWSKSDCNAFIAKEGLPRNEVVDVLHMSGECLCGANAHRAEREEIALWFPAADREIAALEAEVAATGHPACVWGKRPPKVHRQQMNLLDDSMLCRSCA